ncbi:MAG: hypothetical protein B7Z06_01655 [Flavobacteriales bacterium 32-35-8]|nr:MAG: hypothetical protein B7Z06_01655 [Flavobacteriales bacterium 32-35-8]
MDTKCRLCFTELEDTFHVEEMMFGIKESFEYSICKNCKSLSLDKIPDNISKYYPENYYSFAEQSSNKLINWVSKKKCANDLGNTSFIGKIIRLIAGRNSNLYAIGLCKPDKDKTSILDVGCGEGYLLDKLDVQGFNSISGIDPYIFEDIHKPNYKIYKKSIEDLVEEKLKFDIIILSHVFEHLEHPKTSLENILKLLNPKGYLILRTPMSMCFAFNKYGKNWFQIDAPRHILIPSFPGLKNICESMGYDLKYYFFDSDSKQFLISENYKKGIPLISQKLNFIKTRFYPKAIYFGLKAHKLNTKNLGDQSTIVFQKK